MINIYDVETRKSLSHLKGNNSWVRDISFNKNDTNLISCGDDSKLIFWNISDIHNIQKYSTVRIGFDWILCIDFHSDNQTYVTGGIDGKARIMTQSSSYTANIGAPVTKVRFKPDEGNHLKIALASSGKGVIMLDASKMKFHAH